MALAPALRRAAPALVIAAIALAIAWLFAATVLHHTPSLGLPLDDSYIYLTYAKQFGRGQPFTYFPGGGYSAGATSVLWPMVLAPLWTLGARGHALVWASYLLCAALYAATAVGVARVVDRLTGDRVAGVLAAIVLLGIAPFAWSALSGMEVALASALLVAVVGLLAAQPAHGPPTRRLAACLAAASLARPEGMAIVVGVVGVAVIARLRRRERAAAAWWLAPLAAPVAWMVANRLLAGHWLPNTGVAKSYFYLPGFDWTFWRGALWSTTGDMLEGLFWADTSPLVWPRAFAVAWLIGAVRVIAWARREHRPLAAAVILGAPFALIMGVVATSGSWSFHNYRYIAPAFPLLAIVVGVALAAARREPRPALAPTLIALAALAVVLAVAPVDAAQAIAIAAAAAPSLLLAPVSHARVMFSGVVIGAFVHAARPGLFADARLFAQGAVDTNAQVVSIGRFLHDHLPDARVMFHDAGAIAYYGDTEVFDMLGLVTNHQAGFANHGPGARFELLEHLPPERRPTHFAYYRGWLIGGSDDFYGHVLLDTPVGPELRGLTKPRMVGGGNMQVIEARFDHVGTGELPLDPHPGWRVVDRVDLADLDSERAHGWWGAIGRRKREDHTARWSVLGRETGSRGLVLDGGRTIRGTPDEAPGERFSIDVDPARPARLVLRTGGTVGYPYHEAITRPVELELADGDGHVVARTTLAPPTGRFVERAFDLPAGVSEIRTRASGPYRAFHWFVLQPER